MLKINRISIGSLLILGIVFPTAFIEIKSVLFLAIIIISGSYLISRSIKFNRKILIVWFVFPLVGLLYSVYGFFLGNPGALRVLTVMFIYPLLLPIASLTYVKADEKRLFDIMFQAAWILVAVDGFFLFSNIYSPGNGFSEYITQLYVNEAVVDNSESYFKFALPNVSSLVFLIPFFVSAIFCVENGRQKKKILILFVCMSTLAVLSGRRALLVAMFFGPIIAYFLMKLTSNVANVRSSNRHNYLYLFAFVFLLGGLVYYTNVFDFYLSQMASIFDFKDDASNVERATQFGFLFEEISRHPFFGSGAGAAAGYTRSVEQPWAYELTYIALVFQYGIVGFLFYFAGVILLTYGLLISIRRSGALSFSYFFLSGFLSFLIANASNPYLGKFDYMWIIFIPFAILASVTKKQVRGVI